ncbi:MAG TPA: arylesterase [Methylomirabilota bacterium]|jgi:acyl-CoA thioesterase-1
MRGFVPLLLLVLQLVSWVAAPAAPAAEERVIVAFGDSLTAGLGVDTGQTYPALLGERLKREGYDYRVINAGISGDTTAGGLRRVDWALRLKPEIVILELGVNDAFRGQKLTGVRANLDQMITRFQAAGARVLVAGMRLPPNYGDRYAEDFHRLYGDVARMHNAPLIPFFLDGVGAVAHLNQADGIHPTAEGYAIVVDRLWPYLVPLLRK